MAAKIEKKEIGIFTSCSEASYDSTGPILKICARPVNLIENGHAFDYIRGYGDNGEYEHIEAHATIYAKDGDRELNDSYSWRIVYCHEKSEEEMLERGLKGLKHIRRKMSKFYEEEGNPESFGQYVIRFARAIGAKWVMIKREEVGNWDFRFPTDPETVLRHTLAYSKDSINQKISDFLKRHGNAVNAVKVA